MAKHIFVCRSHVIHRAMVVKCLGFGDAVSFLQITDGTFRNLLKGRSFVSAALRKKLRRLFGLHAVKSVC